MLISKKRFTDSLEILSEYHGYIDNIYIRVLNDKIEISKDHNICRIKIEFDVPGIKECKEQTSVEIGTLSAFLKQTDIDEIDFSHKKNFIIKCGNAVLKLSNIIIPPIEWPEVNEEIIEIKNPFIISEIIDNLIPIVQYSENQILKSMLLSSKDNTIVITASDGFRIASSVIHSQLNIKDTQLLIPFGLMTIVQRLFNTNDTIKINISKTLFSISNNIDNLNVSVVGLKLENLYPEVIKLLDKEANISFIINATEIGRACKLFRGVHFNDPSGTIGEIQLQTNKLAIKSDKLLIDLPINLDLEDKYNVSLSMRYLQEGVNFLSISRSENILFKLSENKTFIMVEPVVQQENYKTKYYLATTRY